MALFLGSSMAKGVFQLDEHQAVFHPWWDTVQDYAAFSMVLVGLFAIPQANSYLECSTKFANQTSPAGGTFVNRYCTRENLALFVSYYPYIVIIGPAVLIIIQKFFGKASSGGIKMRKFYSLLVEDTMNTEDMAAMHKENRRDIKELRNEFRGSKSFFVAFLVKLLCELLVSVLYGCWLLFRSWGTTFDCGLDEGSLGCMYLSYMDCTLRGVYFTCIIPHTDFFVYILIFVGALDLLYALVTLYTLMWLTFRGMRKLSSLLKDYQKSVLRVSKRKKWDEEKREEAIDVFGGLDSPDVGLLLNLLAETIGIAPAMRILTLLDAEFHTSWKSQLLHQSNEIGSAHANITFEGAPIGRHLGKSVTRKLMYVTSVTPKPLEEIPIQNFVHKRDEILTDQEFEEGKTAHKHQYTLNYSGLSPGTLYKVTVATSYSGNEIAENYLEFTTRSVPPMGLSVKWGFDVTDETVYYKADLSWSAVGGDSDSLSYIVEVDEDGFCISNNVTEPKFSHYTKGKAVTVVRIWSVIGGNLKSEECLEETLPPVPSLMKDYVARLVRIMPEEAIGSRYLLQVAMLKNVAKELRDLYAEVQGATRVSKTRELNSGDDAISVSEVFLGQKETGSKSITKVED